MAVVYNSYGNFVDHLLSIACDEQKAYEAACEKFRRDKAEAGLFYNIYTANNRMR